MSVATAVGGPTRSTRVRLGFVVGAVLLAVGALLVVLQQRADAQININIGAIVCPIVLSVRNAFADSPFFSFVQPILSAILALFGCSPSG